MERSPSLERRMTLLDLLDRILDKGVIIQGDLTISVANVDLVYVGLKVLLTSIERAEQMKQFTAARSPAAMPLGAPPGGAP
jgi:hypothetical protein